MAMQDDALKSLRSIGNLGARRLTILGVIGCLIFAAIGVGGYLLSRPQYEILYSGLDRQDAARVTSALREANINFDMNADGSTVLVDYGSTSRARMVLAERGLPHNASAGYELFDKLGSLGLTSFMQEVTRVRALEGELSRSIQAMQGVKAARVHLVMSDEGTFRKSKQTASASVVVRISSANDASVAQAIRHLVAAAVPGMTVDTVTVLNTDGVVLASGGEGESSAPVRAAGLEKNISDSLQENIRRTLAPIVGLRNFNVSVVARLNTDKKQTNETIFNPESRVERSVRVIKENQTSQNTANQATASVERNIPGDKGKSVEGKQTTEENQKREELTNYEVSSKSIATTSSGYAIERLSVAILINKASIPAKNGEKEGADSIERRLAEITELASSAAGLNKERGDAIKVAAVEFSENERDIEPVPSPGFLQLFTRQIGSIANAFAMVAAVAVIAIFGIKPLTRAFSTISVQQAALPQNAAVALQAPPHVEHIARSIAPSHSPDNPRKAGQRRLEQFVDSDEEQAAAVLKDWVRSGEKA